MLEGLNKRPFIRPCRVRSVKQTLNDKDKAKLEQAVMDVTWSSKRLETDLRKLGVELSDTSIERHRNGLCSCSKI